MTQEKKKWLSPDGQIAKMKSHGVKFEIMSEEEAREYLQLNNTYFRLRSYRTNFSKHSRGENAGKYENLDFAMLVDIAIIDMYLRSEMALIALDIEHFAKMRLMRKMDEKVSEGTEDGYTVVTDYLITHGQIDEENKVVQEINRGLSSSYTKDLINHYPDYGFPTWAFIELISFGTFCHFYRFCADRFDDRDMQNDFYLLQSVKALRNAAAHNNCLLHKLTSQSDRRPQNAVQQAVSDLGISRNTSRKRLRNDLLQQVATALYMHKELASEGVRSKRAKSLSKLLKRMNRNIDEYYSAKDNPIKSSFEFIAKLVEGWYPCAATDEASKQEPAE